MIIKNGMVFTKDFQFRQQDIEIKQGKITKIADFLPDGEDMIDACGRYVLPGLIDIHTHGAVGTDTMFEDFDFDKWQNYLFSYGITTFFPTTVTHDREKILAVLKKLAANEKVEGINLEGPYLEKSKRGAHDENEIRPGDLAEFDMFFKASGQKLRLTTIAPEVGNNLDFIRQLKKNYPIVVALGHSAAGYDQAVAGYQAGASDLTHTFNAMNSLHHRDPGLVGAALSNDAVFCEVISDGIHLHPSIVKLLYRMLGKDRMVLISDSMAATGLKDGTYSLGNLDCVVKDGVARTVIDGALAGSTHNLMQMLRSAVSFGIPKEAAVQMASLNPAKVVGLEKETGSIAEGKNADLIICGKQFEVLQTMKHGMVVYTKQ